MNLDLLLKVLENDLKDLENWSAHNEDRFWDRIGDMKWHIKTIREIARLDKDNNELLEQGLHNDFIPEV